MKRSLVWLKRSKTRAIFKATAAVSAILTAVWLALTFVPDHGLPADDITVTDGIAVETDIPDNKAMKAPPFSQAGKEAWLKARREEVIAVEALARAKQAANAAEPNTKAHAEAQSVEAEAQLRWAEANVRMTEIMFQKKVAEKDQIEGRSSKGLSIAEARALLVKAQVRLLEAKVHMVDETRKKIKAEQSLLEGRQTVVEQPIVTVEQALSRMKLANVAFNAPHRARVGQDFVIELKLSRVIEKNELKILIKEAGAVEEATLKVSDRVVTTLGGSSFDVSPTGPLEQLLSDTEPTSWTWTVTPKSAGPDQVLILALETIISINGKDAKRINTFTRRINVDVNWPDTISEWLELIRKTGENVSWIWVTILVPIVGGVWAWLKARKWLARPKSGATPVPTGPDLGSSFTDQALETDATD